MKIYYQPITQNYFKAYIIFTQCKIIELIHILINKKTAEQQFSP